MSCIEIDEFTCAKLEQYFHMCDTCSHIIENTIIIQNIGCGGPLMNNQ